jgi:hypothetical protein
LLNLICNEACICFVSILMFELSHHIVNNLKAILQFSWNAGTLAATFCEGGIFVSCKAGIMDFLELLKALYKDPIL